MGLIPSSVFRTSQLLVYRLESDNRDHGSSIVIPGSGDPSPDLLTDAPGGALKAIFSAPRTGLGPVPPGPLTTAHANALLFCDDPERLFGSENVPRARMWLQTREGAGDWGLHASVDKAGDLAVIVTKGPGRGVAYLYLQANHSLVTG